MPLLRGIFYAVKYDSQLIKRFKRMKSLHRIILFLFASVLLLACANSKPKPTGYLELRGYAQGTSYQIVYKDTIDRKDGVQKILDQIDREFNLWDSTSVISRLNKHHRTDTVFSFKDTTLNFTIMMELSKEFYEKTNQAFDPSVLPLLELWKFGKDETYFPSQLEIDSVLEFVGFSEFDFWLNDNPYDDDRTKNTEIIKSNGFRRLDFNAIAQGYTSDLIGDYFAEKGISDFMVNVGGEIKVSGVNPQGNNWTIGIQNPSVKGEQAESLVTLSNCGVATSGSYRNYKEIDGVKYSHTIDGRTGYPVKHNLLSCTVVAATAYEADAYATAFMVMGTEEVDVFLRENPELGLEVYLIEDLYGKYHVTYTENFPLVEDNISNETE